LAGVACFSPYHFHRVFRGMVGEPVAEYVRRLRLDQAAINLRHSKKSVTDLALRWGYDSLEAFTRAFRQRFGVSPSQYRNLMQTGGLGTDVKARLIRGANMQAEMDKGAVQQVEIVQTDPKRVAFVRHVGPYAECEAAWEKLCAWAGPAGLLGPDAVLLGLCHDDPEITSPEKIRYDACLVIGPDASPSGGVGVQEIAGGGYAKALHKGPFDRLINTYAWVCGQWLPGQNREMRNLPSYEIYLNDPAQTPAEEILTEVYIPLED
jgi:AraC family transcriptional regulator